MSPNGKQQRRVVAWLSSAIVTLVVLAPSVAQAVPIYIPKPATNLSFATVMGPPRCHDLGTTSRPCSRSGTMILRRRDAVKNCRQRLR